MDYSFLERLKSKVIAGAQTSAVKIEEAARTGKLHLDGMAQRRKLHNAYAELGKEVHQALVDDAMTEFAQRSKVSTLRAGIDRCLFDIAAIDESLARKKAP